MTETVLTHKLLSVIIPTYNAAATLRAQLDALCAQTYAGPWEVLVVNNRSTDDSVKIAEAYQSFMPQLRIVQAPAKQGRAYTCNVGAREARGDVLIFCDADDVAASGWLLALARMAAIHPVVAGSIEVNHLNQALPWRPNPFTSSNQPVLGFLPYAPGANIAIAREAFDSVGGFSEDTPPCEDVDIAWRLQLKGYTIHDAPEAVMHIRYRETMHTLWKQIAMYGECHAFLYKRFAPYGMPRSSLRAAWRKCLWLLALAPRLPYADLKERSAWLYAAAARWGRLRGSLRYHTLYL